MQSQQRTNIKLVTLLNYPQPHEQLLHVDRFTIQLPTPKPTSSYDWVQLRSSLIEFGSTVTTEFTTAGCGASARKLQSVLAMNGLSGSEITMYGEDWVGVIDSKECSYVELHSLHFIRLEIS